MRICMIKSNHQISFNRELPVSHGDWFSLQHLAIGRTARTLVMERVVVQRKLFFYDRCLFMGCAFVCNHEAKYNVTEEECMI